uniref:Ctenidin-3-like n=1 Tax=Nicotiana tabacum TaxID=4097 RepID=A0A1S4DDD7_TOBAC
MERAGSDCFFFSSRGGGYGDGGCDGLFGQWSWGAMTTGVVVGSGRRSLLSFAWCLDVVDDGVFGGEGTEGAVWGGGNGRWGGVTGCLGSGLGKGRRELFGVVVMGDGELTGWFNGGVPD